MIQTDTITLGALLKWAGVVSTGGGAKALITGCSVRVNGEVEVRRGRQLAPGDVVGLEGGPTLLVVKADHAAPAPALASRLP